MKRYGWAFFFGGVGWVVGYFLLVFLSRFIGLGGIVVWFSTVGLFTGLGLDAVDRSRPRFWPTLGVVLASLAIGLAITSVSDGVTDSSPGWIGPALVIGSFLLMVAAAVLVKGLRIFAGGPNPGEALWVFRFVLIATGIASLLVGASIVLAQFGATLALMVAVPLWPERGRMVSKPMVPPEDFACNGLGVTRTLQIAERQLNK